MELLLILIPGYIFVKTSQKAEWNPNLHDAFFQAKKLDGWQLALLVGTASLMLAALPMVLFKASAFFYIKKHSLNELQELRTSIHEIVGLPYFFTFFSAFLLSWTPLLRHSRFKDMQFLGKYIFFPTYLIGLMIEKYVIRSQQTAYDRIIRNLAERNRQVFLKLNSGSYMIGLIGYASPDPKDDQISIYPMVSGIKRKPTPTEVGKFNTYLKKNNLSTPPAIDGEKEYLIFDSSYELRLTLEMCTNYFLKLSDIEYISEYHNHINTSFIRQGKTLMLSGVQKDFKPNFKPEDKLGNGKTYLIILAFSKLFRIKQGRQPADPE